MSFPVTDAVPSAVSVAAQQTFPSTQGDSMKQAHRTIKLRVSAPAFRAAAAASTVVALVATVGAPWKFG